jgi:sugar porter (SP) family MFS transporter
MYPLLTPRIVIIGTVVAIYDIGCAIGALSCFVLGDIFGRRHTVLGSGLVSLAGITIQASSYSIGQLIAGRIITGQSRRRETQPFSPYLLTRRWPGLGVGGFTATVPMWVSEGAKAETRGRLVLLQGAFALAGIVTADWLEFGLYFEKTNSANWRFPIAFQAFYVLVVLFLTLHVPESPRWLVKKDRVEDAKATLSRLSDEPPDSDKVNADLAAIQGSLAHDAAHGSSPFSLGENRHLLRTFLAMFGNMAGQMTGVNVVTFYSTVIFEQQLHYSPVTARIISSCLQVWQFLSAVCAIFLVDRFGRRKLLISAALGIAVSQACLAGLTSDLANQSAANAAIFFYFTALFSIPIGLLSVPYMYAAEITPLSVRTQVTAMGAATNWVCNFLIAEVTPVGFATIAWRYYIVFAAIGFFSACVFYVLYPETKGRNLEEIDWIFVQSKTIFDPVRVERELPVLANLTSEADIRAKDGSIVEERVEQV